MAWALEAGLVELRTGAEGHFETGLPVYAGFEAGLDDFEPGALVRLGDFEAGAFEVGFGDFEIRALSVGLGGDFETWLYDLGECGGSDLEAAAFGGCRALPPEGLQVHRNVWVRVLRGFDPVGCSFGRSRDPALRKELSRRLSEKEDAEEPAASRRTAAGLRGDNALKHGGHACRLTTRQSWPS